MIPRPHFGDRSRLAWVVIASTIVTSFAVRLSAQTQFEFPPDARSASNKAVAELDDMGPDAKDFLPTHSRLMETLVRRDSGISVEPVYYGEIFTNAKGGLSTRNATRYQALLDLPLALDFEKLQLPLPGSFFLLAQNTHGQGLTEEFVGDTQVVSNIDSFDNINQISEYWWEIGLLEDNLRIRLGKQDVNTEFLVMDVAEDFVQSSFGLSPSAGFSSYPNPSMAAVMLVQLTPSLELKAGIWDAFAGGGTWGFSGNDVTFTFGELEYEYTILDGRLPGKVDVGIVYVSGGDVLGITAPSARGYYIQVEQLVLRENPCQVDDEQGLGAFVSYFPRFANGPVSLSVIHENIATGIVYRGLLPHREEDVAGAGVAWAQLNQGGTNQETVVEFFYKAQVKPWISVQPDLQYVFNPSGIQRDAFVAGIRFEMAL